MRSIVHWLLVAGALAGGAAHAQQQVLQTQNTVSPVLEVQRLAPQLVPFAGGDVNFQNLVNGLAFGVPVTLTTAVAPGVTQVVSFTPSGAMTPLAIAQMLENARQVAIGNGIATPTAQQLGVILTGGNPAATSVATQTSPAAMLQSQRSFNTSDSPLPRGVSDTPLVPPTSTTPTGTIAAPVAAQRVVPGIANPSGAGGTARPAATPRFGVAR